MVILFHDRPPIRQDSPPGPAPPGFSGTGVKHLSGITFQLHDATGQRKYLTRDERDAFLEAAGKASTRTRQLYNKLPEEISLDEIERIHL